MDGYRQGASQADIGSSAVDEGLAPGRAPLGAAHRPWSTLLLWCLVASLARWLLFAVPVLVTLLSPTGSVSWNLGVLIQPVGLVVLIVWTVAARRGADAGRRAVLARVAVVSAVAELALLALWLRYLVVVVQLGLESAPQQTARTVAGVVVATAIGGLYALGVVAGTRTFLRIRG
ncbi:MAG: hypothetical protein KQH57_17705 [Actinomycetales bacterium]|nr:hypothetical protein [Actinomycetales bacterium]